LEKIDYSMLIKNNGSKRWKVLENTFWNMVIVCLRCF